MQVFGFPPWLKLWVAGPTSLKGGSFCIFFDGTSPLMYMFMLLLFSCSVVSDCLRPMDCLCPMDCSTQASLSFTISWSLLKFMYIESVMLTFSSSLAPFSSCLQSFPESGSFPVSWFFTSNGQSIGASTLVLPMNIQERFPLGLTGLISL